MNINEVAKLWKNNTKEPAWCNDNSGKAAVTLAKRLYHESRTKKVN